MTTTTQRIPILVTVKEKAQIAKMATDAGMSMGEYLRRAAATYRGADDDALLESMIGQMLESTKQTSRAINEAVAFVQASNRRMDSVGRGRRKAT